MCCESFRRGNSEEEKDTDEAGSGAGAVRGSSAGEDDAIRCGLSHTEEDEEAKERGGDGPLWTAFLDGGEEMDGTSAKEGLWWRTSSTGGPCVGRVRENQASVRPVEDGGESTEQEVEVMVEMEKEETPVPTTGEEVEVLTTGVCPPLAVPLRMTEADTQEADDMGLIMAYTSLPFSSSSSSS